jgi:hypothetical protein
MRADSASDNLQRDYLSRHGWPRIPDVTRTVVRTTGSYFSNIREEALRSLGLASICEWWELLDAITSSDEDLKDMFFDGLVRNVEPSTMHQYAAFLTHVMNWQLLLTTNFDRLLETALHQQGLSSVAYELRDMGSLPNADLVRANRAIIKLHGGAFGLLTGALLNVPLDYKRRTEFLKYIDKDSLLLILGYKGADRRVSHLIEHHCRRSTHDTAALWVCRTDVPAIAPLLPRTNYVIYQNAGSFLQELHGRLTSSHPVSATRYRALSQQPPRPMPSVSLIPELQEKPAVVFFR